MLNKTIIGFGWGVLPPRALVFGWGGKATPDLQWKHIQFINIEDNLMFRVISEASVMTDSSHKSWNMSPIRSIFKGFPISHAQTFI